jgi:hypothetical protein
MAVRETNRNFMNGVPELLILSSPAVSDRAGSVVMNFTLLSEKPVSRFGNSLAAMLPYPMIPKELLHFRCSVSRSDENSATEVAFQTFLLTIGVPQQ